MALARKQGYARSNVAAYLRRRLVWAVEAKGVAHDGAGMVEGTNAEVIEPLSKRLINDAMLLLATAMPACATDAPATHDGLSLEALSELAEQYPPPRFDIIVTLSHIKQAMIDAVAERDVRLGIEPLGKVSRLLGPLIWWGVPVEDFPNKDMARARAVKLKEDGWKPCLVLEE